VCDKTTQVTRDKNDSDKKTQVMRDQKEYPMSPVTCHLSRTSLKAAHRNKCISRILFSPPKRRSDHFSGRAVADALSPEGEAILPASGGTRSCIRARI